MTTATAQEIYDTAAAKITGIKIIWSEADTFSGVEGKTISLKMAEALAIAAHVERVDYDPEGGFYFKTKFEMTFANGDTHTGRLDIDTQPTTFVGHVLSAYASFLDPDAGFVRESHKQMARERLDYLTTK